MTKKEIRHGIEKAIGDYIFKIEASTSSKKVNKLVSHHSKKLAEAVKDELKKKVTKTNKIKKQAAGKAAKTVSVKTKGL